MYHFLDYIKICPILYCVPFMHGNIHSGIQKQCFVFYLASNELQMELFRGQHERTSSAIKNASNHISSRHIAVFCMSPLARVTNCRQDVLRMTWDMGVRGILSHIFVLSLFHATSNTKNHEQNAFFFQTYTNRKFKKEYVVSSSKNNRLLPLCGSFVFV